MSEIHKPQAPAEHNQFIFTEDFRFTVWKTGGRYWSLCYCECPWVVFIKNNATFHWACNLLMDHMQFICDIIRGDRSLLFVLYSFSIFSELSLFSVAYCIMLDVQLQCFEEGNKMFCLAITVYLQPHLFLNIIIVTMLNSSWWAGRNCNNLRKKSAQ